MNKNRRTIIAQSLELLVKPIVRLCLRDSVKYQEFSEIVKRSFISSARAELEERGLTPSDARLSVMTGLQRRDIANMDRRPNSTPHQEENLILRVIGQWVSDKRFSDGHGHARALTCKGKKSEFAKLTYEVSRDLNPYATLFELQRLQNVIVKNGKAILRKPSFEPRHDLKNGLSLLASDISDLISSVDQNLNGLGGEMPNLHARTTYDNINPSKLPQIRRWLLEQGIRLHEKARHYLAKFDRDLNPKHKVGGGRVVLATFSVTNEAPKESLVRDKEALSNTKETKEIEYD